MILESIEGVAAYEYDARSEAFLVTFDDARTTVERIAKELESGGFRVRGRLREPGLPVSR